MRLLVEAFISWLNWSRFVWLFDVLELIWSLLWLMSIVCKSQISTALRINFLFVCLLLIVTGQLSEMSNTGLPWWSSRSKRIRSAAASVWLWQPGGFTSIPSTLSLTSEVTHQYRWNPSSVKIESPIQVIVKEEPESSKKWDESW